jgi:transposase-like protein
MDWYACFPNHNLQTPSHMLHFIRLSDKVVNWNARTHARTHAHTQISASYNLSHRNQVQILSKEGWWKFRNHIKSVKNAIRVSYTLYNFSSYLTKNTASIKNTNQLMRFREIIDGYCDYPSKNTNRVCGRTAEIRMLQQAVRTVPLGFTLLNTQLRHL